MHTQIVFVSKTQIHWTDGYIDKFKKTNNNHSDAEDIEIMGKKTTDVIKTK